MSQFIEAEGEIIKITYVHENKQEDPIERYVIADDIKQAITIFEAFVRDAENPVLINKAELVGLLPLCNTQQIYKKTEKEF